jgi:hypothetical protein
MATYRFYAQLQKGGTNLATSAENFTSPPTNSEAVAVVEGIRSKGKDDLNRKAHDDFESAVDGIITWIENLKGLGASYDGNGDVHREIFKYGGEEYRLDIGVGGEMSVHALREKGKGKRGKG